MKLRTLIMVCIGLVVLSPCGLLWGDLAIHRLGQPLPGLSWQQRFRVASPSDFDLVAIRMVSDDRFEHEALSDFSVGGWSLLYENDPLFPTLASAGGPEAAGPTPFGGFWHLAFAVKFEGDHTDFSLQNPLVFDFLVFEKGKDQAMGTQVEYFGQVPPGGEDWVIGLVDRDVTRSEAMGESSTVVPNPAALALGLVGLGLVGWVMRKRA